LKVESIKIVISSKGGSVSSECVCTKLSLYLL
jgi:hypothetical protein